MLFRYKIKAACDIFGDNTVWNLLNLHTYAATLIGWLYFFFGNYYYITNGYSIYAILEHNAQSAKFAMWAASFLFAVHVYKNLTKKV